MAKRGQNTWVVFIIVLGILSVVLYSFEHRPVHTIPVEKINLTQLTLASTTISVEIVRTPAERDRGLSGRLSLAPDRGMLFLFDHPDTYGFWMPEMQFPIDIIWLNGNWQIVDIAHAVAPESYPHVFVPKAPATFVLEVVAGLSERSGWQEGDQFTIPE